MDSTFPLFSGYAEMCGEMMKEYAHQGTRRRRLEFTNFHNVITLGWKY